MSKPSALPRPHLAVVRAAAPAEAATDIGFESERAPRRSSAWRNPITALRIWRGRWLLRTLRADLKRTADTLEANTALVMEKARHGRVTPWWPDCRRELQLRRAVLTARIANVVAELAALGHRA